MARRKPKGCPPADKRWGAQVIEEWYDVWEDEDWARNIRAGLHIPALNRLFTYKARWYVLNDQMYSEPMLVTGSRGNQVKNPILSELRELEETILRMEKEFGMTLRSASLIDLDLGQGAKTWAELQQMNRAGSKGALANQPVRGALPVVEDAEVID